MPSIVKQFRAFEDTEPITEMYFWNCQKLASKMVRECTRIKDDEKLLARLREHSTVFVNSMQTVAPEFGKLWREFLHELINDVTENETFLYSLTPIPDWYIAAWQQIGYDRIGNSPNFDAIKFLVMDGISRLPLVGRFAGDCKNIVAAGKMLPNITRDIVETGEITHNVLYWFGLVEIYTRQYQGRDLYRRAEYARLVKHLGECQRVTDDIMRIGKMPLDKNNHKRYIDYFLRRVADKDLHLAATFLCDNFNVFDEFDRKCGRNRLSGAFTVALGMAAMLQTGETKMSEQKPVDCKQHQIVGCFTRIPKPGVSADLGRKLGDLLKEPPEKLDRMTERVIEKDIDELIANLKQAREQLAQMRDAAAKLRATINKSKKLIADWEC